MTVIILLGFPLLKRIFCNWKLFTHNCTSFCWWLPVMFSWILCKKYIDWLLSFLGLLFKQTFLWYIVFCSGFVENIFVFDNHALTRITKINELPVISHLRKHTPEIFYVFQCWKEHPLVMQQDYWKDIQQDFRTSKYCLACKGQFIILLYSILMVCSTILLFIVISLFLWLFCK